LIRDVNLAENRSAKAGESEKKIFAIRRSEAKANFFVKKRKKATKIAIRRSESEKFFYSAKRKFFTKSEKKRENFLKSEKKRKFF